MYSNCLDVVRPECIGVVYIIVTKPNLHFAKLTESCKSLK